MKYLGGKSRIAKSLSRAILDNTSSRRLYIEPFLGAGSVAVGIAPHFNEVRLSDVSPDLIELWLALQGGWIPPSLVTEDEYCQQRYADVSAFRGFVGYGCSFSGKWFGGYARGEDRNFAREAKDSLTRRIPSIRHASFTCADYRDISIPRESVVYCDPPYRNTTGFSRTGDFDSDEFWKIAESWSEYASVYISEYQAPDGWISIWEADVTVTISRGNYHRAIEHLWLKSC
jgi:DNA adenine methylase